MAVYNTGYDDERFEHAVGHTFHCIICTNVIKDPVMCRQNEHLFCRACITQHLAIFQTCPSCIEPLTVDTLRQAPRTVINLLDELKIRCEFFDRGCGKFIELGGLERHVRECGFAPAACSNDECQLQVNRRDLLHHETAVCEKRRVQCHNCSDIRQEMDTVKVSLAAMNEKLDRNEKMLDRNKDNLEVKFENVKAVVGNVVAKVEMVQEQLNNKDVNSRHVQGDILEMKESLNEITKQLKGMSRITQQTSGECQNEREQVKKAIAEADSVDREPEIFLFGGWNDYDMPLDEVKIFNLSKRTWSYSGCSIGGAAASLVYQNQIMLIGGHYARYNDEFDSRIAKLSMNSDDLYRAITVEDFPATLPHVSRSICHVYDESLIVIGGFTSTYVDDTLTCPAYLDQKQSNTIYEVLLVPPYTSKVLTTIPWEHINIYNQGVVLIDGKIVFVGGVSVNSVHKTVLMYDITRNEWKELAPLPYPVKSMAIVKWGDDNLIIVGGADGDHNRLNSVLIYNIKTQKSHMLPDMKYKRERCLAVVVRDTVVVMGGQGEKEYYLQTVEGFRFDRYTWEELPAMRSEESSSHSAVVW